MSTALREPTQDEIDAGLEREIETTRMAAMAAAGLDPDLAREYFALMAEMIACRSPQQIARMEKERGLA